MSHLIVFDWDGTLADDVGPNRSILSSSLHLAGAAALRHASAFARVGVCTNQGPRICAGIDTREGCVLHLSGELRSATHSRTHLQHRVLVCPHARSERCLCRKPEPALLYMAKDSVFSSLGNDTILWMVGDKWSDVLAGVRAGFSTVLVGEYPYVQKGTTPVPDGLPAPNYVVADAAEAVRTIRSVSGLGR